MWGALLGWHVDDAAITYAYAANAAEGLGFRATASAPLVEGFSNPAWTLLLTAFAALGVPVLVASKALQALLGAATLLLVHHVTVLAGGDRAEGTGAATIVAISAPFAVWTAGGLETALLAFGIVAFLYGALRGLPGVLTGLFGGIVVLARPEGVVLAGALFLAAEALVPLPRWRTRRLAAGATTALLLLAWLAFRWVTFGTLLPNTWWAKLDAPVWARAAYGSLYTATFAAEVALPLLVVGLVTSWRVPRLRRLAQSSSLVLACGGAAVLYMGGDWMRHGRLYAHLVPVLALACGPGLLILFFRPSDLGKPLLPGAGRLLAWLFVAGYAGIQILFWQDALRRPPLPMALVSEVGRLFAAVGPTACGEPALSAALPDVGGVLLDHPDARILDLGALVDARAARAFGPDHWPERIAEERPQLVLVHGPWVPRTGLDEGALSSAGYRLLCRRAGTPGPLEREFPPSLWLRDDCLEPLPPTTRETLDAWCARPR